jgi:hypothetical protein
MTRSGALVCVAIYGVVTSCGGSLSAPTPTGTPLFAEARVSMTFTPQDQTFAEPAEAYHRAWVAEGSAIIEAMERSSGLRFLESHVSAVIYEGVSRSGGGDAPMYLRASYPADVKKATLVHEHGHRLIAQLRTRPADLDEHRVLDLFLYDVWESLWGSDFANQQVTFESGLTGLYDYKATWAWALSISKEERASRLAAIVRANSR